MIKEINIHKIDLLAVFILLLAGCKLIFGLENYLDIILYDDSNYLYAGAELADRGFPHAQGAPLYALFYYMVSLVQQDRIVLFYTVSKILTILVPILIYSLLRKYGLQLLASLAISYCFVICPVNLSVWPKPSHFALCIILSSFIISPDKKFSVIVPFGCIGALLSSYVRPEFFLTYLLLTFFYFSAVIVIFKKLYEEIISVLAVALISGILIYLFGLPMFGTGSRSIDAFVQHFALNWVNWTKSSLNPWTDCGEILSQNFSNFKTIPKAFISNPFIFLKHIYSNLIHAPINLLRLFSVHSVIPFSDSMFCARIGRYLIPALSACYIFHSKNTWLPNLRNNIREYKWLLSVFSFYFLTSLISVIVIYPRNHYLILPAVLITVTAALFTVKHDCKQIFNNYNILILVGFLMISVVPSHQIKTNKANIETINFILSLKITDEVNMLEAEGGFNIYLGKNFRRVAEYDKTTTNFNQFLKDEKINMIVMTETLINDSRFRTDKDWHYFLSNYESMGYKELYIPNTERQLFVDNSLL